MRLHKDNIDRWFDFGVHLETRTIYVGEEVGELAAEKLIKGVHLLRAADEEKPIRIILNSPGGDWDHGIAMYDFIAACPFNVTIEVVGHAMSMATIILQAADHRVIHPNSRIMIHDGTESLDGVTPRSFEAWARESKATRETMYRIFAERSGKAEKYWEKRCANDFIMTAEEAVESGLADNIATDAEDLECETESE